jgi:hypothetical protein
MSKHHTDFDFDIDFSTCPESGNLHLFMTEELFSRIDCAMAVGSIKTREDFGTISILYLLKQFGTDAGQVTTEC